MRAFLIALVLGSLALAQGLVLPFEGPQGASTARAVAQSLDAPPPTLAGLLLPEPPWQGGWRVLTPSLASPAGARLIWEATGADWVLTGRLTNGQIEVFLFDGEQSQSARFTNALLLERWAAQQLDHPARAVQPEPDLEPVLQRILQGQLPPTLPAGLAEEAALLEAARARNVDPLTGLLPEPMLAFWRGLRDPSAFPEAGIGPVWRAFLPLQNDDRPTALARAARLAESPRALDQSAALILFRGLGDDRWREVARSLTEVAPELVFGWEMRSFAAFDQDNGAEAREALERAVQLNPEEALYWTNLGWARYLTGDVTGAIRASVQAMRLEPNSTAAYNLGLFHALAGNHLDAQRFYLQALRLDDENEVEIARQDLEDAGRSDLLYYQGFLLERAGRVAEALEAYRAFLEAHPAHVLAPEARRAIARLGQVRREVRIQRLALQPDGVDARPFGAGEQIWPVVELVGEPALARGEVRTLLLKDGQVVDEASFELNVPPITADWRGNASPVTPPEPGRYQLVVRYLDAEARLTLRVGPPNLARRLFALGLEVRGLDGTPLLTPAVALSPTGEARLLAAIAEELRRAAPRAREVARFNQILETGPFPGMTVAEVMEQATPETVRVFLEAVVQRPELLGDRDVVNAFAEWASGAGR